jgi:hypothetical protein
MAKNKLNECILKLLFKLKNVNVCPYPVLSLKGNEVVTPK